MWSFWLACAGRQVDDWSTAVQSNTLVAYQSYLDGHPESDQAGDAVRALDDLRWAAAEEVQTVEAYASYLQSSPTGLYRGFAAIRIEELDFVEALAASTPEALEAFVARHRNSRLADQARETLDRMHYGVAAVADTSQDYSRYLTVYPDGEFANSAKSERERAAFDEAALGSTMTSWLDYLNRFPSGEYTDEARKQIDALRFQEVDLVVVLRGSSRPAEAWTDSLRLVQEMVDFTVANSLRDIGFKVAISSRVSVDDSSAPSAASAWVPRGEHGVLVVDYWELAYPVRWSTSMSTRVRTQMAMYTPDGDVPVWRDSLTATSSIKSVMDTDAQLHRSAVENLASALARTALPVDPYFRVQTASR